MTGENEDETVLTAVIDNEHRYARTGREFEELVRYAVEVAHPAAASLFYVWDRPCRSFRDGEPEYPDHQLRVYTDPDSGYGAMNYWHVLEARVWEGWDSYNSEPPARAPTLWFDPSTPTAFRPNAALPLDQIREAVEEFVRTSQRPTCIQWQEAQYY